MEILASCGIEEAIKHEGKLVIPVEDKKSPDKVSINVVVEDGDTEVYKKLTGNEKCITFVGNPASFCPTELEGKVFNEFSFEDLENGKVEEVKGIITLIRLDKGYSNMKFLYDYNAEHPEIRFIGGKLIGIDGVNIGRFDKGKEKMPPVFEEMYDSFLECQLDELENIQEVIKRNKKKVSGMSEKAEKKTKKKAPSKRKISFTNLFGDNNEEF